MQGQTALPNSCTHNPDLIIGLLAVPYGTVWDATALANIQETIQDGLINNTYAEAYHYFGDFEGIDDQSEERQQETFGYGNKVTTRDERYYWTFRYTDGHMCKHKAYLAFKGRENEFQYFIVDKSRNIIGTEAYDADGFVTGMRGLTVYELYENNWKPKDGTNDTMFNLSIGFSDSKELNEFYAFVTVGFDISSLLMVKDAVLSPLTTLNGGAVTVAILAGCGGQNLVQNYPALATAGLYTANNKLTGAAVTITGVSITGLGASQAILFDIDDTDPDYPTSGNYLTITLDPPGDVFTAIGDYYRAQPVDLKEV